MAYVSRSQFLDNSARLVLAGLSFSSAAWWVKLFANATSYFRFQEIAVVFFTPHRDESDVERYDQLFKYLIERHRCAAFGSIGDSIKDMYIWPLARDSVVPSVLLPFTRPGSKLFHRGVGLA